MEGGKVTLGCLENIELQFALSKNTSQFQALIWSYLKTVVTGLSSSNKDVLNKASALLEHVCKRFNSETDVKLPLKQMLDMCSVNNTSGQSQRDVVILLIEMGYKRESLEESIGTIPDLLKGITERTVQQQAIIVGILFEILSKCGNLDNSYSAKFEKVVRNIDVKGVEYIFSLMMILMIYEVPGNILSQEYYPQSSPYLGEVFRTVSFRGRHSWVTNKTDLDELKIGILSTLSKQKIFGEKEFADKRALVFLCASVDNCSEVNSVAKLKLKISTEANPDERPQLLNSLVKLYIGDIYRGSDTRNINVPDNLKLAIAKMFQKLRTFNSSHFPHEIIFNEIISTSPSHTGSKLYIELLRLGLKILSDFPSGLPGLNPANILKIFLRRFEACSDSDDGKIQSTKSLLYQIIGVLCKSIGVSEPEVKLALLKLFWGVCNEPHSVRLVIHNVILELLPHIKNIKLSEQHERNIIDLTLDCATKKSSEALYCLILFINSVFSFSSIESKYINIIAIKRSRYGLEELGRNGLKFPDPPKFVFQNSSESEVQRVINSWRAYLPNFLNFVGFLHLVMRGKNVYNFKYYDAISKIESSEKEKSFGNITMGTLCLGLEFARQLFMLSADPWINRASVSVVGTLSSTNVQVYDAVGLQRMANYAIEISGAEKSNLSEQSFDPGDMNPGEGESHSKCLSLATYINLLILSLCSPQSENYLKVICIHILNELVKCLPSEFLGLLLAEVPLLKSLLNITNPQISHGSAILIGALVTMNLEMESDEARLKKIIEELLNDATNPMGKIKLSSAMAGAKVALGSILGNTLHKYKDSASRYISEEKMSQIMDVLTSELIGQGNFVVSNLNTLCVAVSEACRYGSIPRWSDVLEHEAEYFRNQIMSVSSVAPLNYQSKPLALAKKLIYLLDSSLDQKSQENILDTLCNLVIDYPNIRETLLRFFVTLAPRFSKKTESLAILGESISRLISGRDSVLLERYFYIPNTREKVYIPVIPAPSSDPHTSVLAELALNHLTSAMAMDSTSVAYNPKEHLVFLLCIVKLCGHETAVADRCADIMEFFAKFLPDETIPISNLACEGICALLSNSSDNEKLSLIRVLDEKLCSIVNRSTAIEATNSPHLCTYFAISSLLSGLNRPDMIYKLLLIAWGRIHWTLRFWATRNMGDVCVSNLSEFSRELFPKLYVLRFHPSRETSADIENIWKVLTLDHGEFINDYDNEICDEILQGINHESYVVKEQSCSALENFVSSAKLQRIIPKIMDIHSALSGNMDNIIESVRNSAFSACRALCLAVISCINDVKVPFMERKSIASLLIDALIQRLSIPDKNVEALYLSIISKLQDCSPKVIEESLEALIKSLFQNFSSYRGHTSSHSTFYSLSHYNASQQLEHSSLESIKASPVVESLIKFYAMLPATTANDIMQYVIDMLGNSTLFSQKVACLLFIQQASGSVPCEWTFNTQLVTEVFFPLVKSSSAALSSSSSLALSALCKSSKAIMAISLRKITSIYFNEKDDEPRLLLGSCAYLILKSERTLERSMLEEFAPTAYIASRKTSKSVQIEGWTKVWECISSFILPTWRHDIMNLCVKAAIPIIEYSQYDCLRIQAAIAVKEVCTSMNININDDLAPRLLSAFVEVLSAQNTTRIHEIITSFAEVVRHLAWYINKRESHYLNRRVILNVFLSGIKSEDAEVVYHSLEVLALVYTSIGAGLYFLVQDPLLSVAESFSNNNHSKVVNTLSGRALELKIHIMAFETIKKLWEVARPCMEEHIDHIIVFLVSCLRECVWNLQDTILDTIIVLLRDSNVCEAKTPENKGCITVEHLTLCTGTVLECAKITKYTDTIKKAFDCLEVLVQKLELSRSPSLEASLKEMSSICEALTSSSAGVHITAVLNRLKSRIHHSQHLSRLYLAG